MSVNNLGDIDSEKLVFVTQAEGLALGSPQSETAQSLYSTEAGELIPNNGVAKELRQLTFLGSGLPLFISFN
jgi:hypothetical protein